MGSRLRHLNKSGADPTLPAGWASRGVRHDGATRPNREARRFAW